MADILILPASQMVPAPTGQVTLFIDTENNNILSYINDAGEVFVYNYGTAQSDLEKCCSCEIAKRFMDSVTCALNGGLITATEFGTIINSGLLVTTTETVDADTGAKVCTVEIGPKQVNPIAVTQITVTQPVPPVELIVSGTMQLTAAILPVNATNQNVIWVSSNPSKAIVNASGLVTGVSTGTVTIYAYSQGNPTVFGFTKLTVNP